MPIVRVDEKGQKLINKKARLVAYVSAGIVGIGILASFSSEPMTGLYIMLLGNSLASIWNLSDNS